MKTADQIYHHLLNCHFSDEEWSKVKAFCHKFQGGCQIKRGEDNTHPSSYEQFLEWLSEGFGSGDVVSYGNTIGVVTDSYPDSTFLGAYFDFEGNVIKNTMSIADPSRLKKATDEEKIRWKTAFFNNGYDYYVREGAVRKIPELHEGQYYKLATSKSDEFLMGLLKCRESDTYKFYGFSLNGKILVNYQTPCNNIPLRLATRKDITRFHNQLERAGIQLIHSTCEFIKKPRKRKNQKYWYVNELFEVVADRDNGEKKHIGRRNAKNYFEDELLAIDFANQIQKIREEV